MTDSPGKDARDRARECLRDQKQRDAASGSVAFYHSTSAMVSIETAINAMLAFATTEASLSDGGGEASLRKAVEPWAGYDGDLPDYDDPLHCVFCSGVEYAVRLLAKELGVATWEQCDGTEEFDGDLGGTLMNIVREAMPTDKHGEQMWPSEVREALSSLSQAVEGWREKLIEAEDAGLTLAAEVVSGITHWGLSSTKLEAVERFQTFAASTILKQKEGTAIRLAERERLSALPVPPTLEGPSE